MVFYMGFYMVCFYIYSWLFDHFFAVVVVVFVNQWLYHHFLKVGITVSNVRILEICHLARTKWFFQNVPSRDGKQLKHRATSYTGLMQREEA